MRREPTSAPWRYMGFWDRLIASLLDNVIVLLVLVPWLLWSHGLDALLDPTRTPEATEALVSHGLPALFVLAFWIACQATPGKLAFHGRIVDAVSGGRPRAWQWFVRYLGYFVSLLPLGLGFVWIGIDPRRQGWHDKLARTVVVHRGTRGPLADFGRSSPQPTEIVDA